MTNIDLIKTLAQEIEITDPIDWGYLSINESDAYELMATHVLDLCSRVLNNKEVTYQAIITKLLVENFVLHLQVLQHGK